MTQTPIDPKSEAAIRKFYQDYYDATGQEPSGSMLDAIMRGEVPSFDPTSNPNISSQGTLMTDDPSMYQEPRGWGLGARMRGAIASTSNRLRFGDDGYRPPQETPLTEEEFIEQRQESDVAAGRDQLPYEEYQRMYRESIAQPSPTTQPTGYRSGRGLPYINPGGSSYSSRLYLAGRGFAEEDRKGLGTLQGVAGLASAGIGLTGDFLAGLASGRRQEYIEDWERQNRMQDKNYVSAPQYRDSNYTGGMPFKDGGMKNYPNGGLFDPVERQRRKNERKASPGLKLFPNQYGEENYFEDLKEGDSTVQNVGYADKGFFGSMKKAMELNKETRQEGLDRDKVRLLAFHNRKATERTQFKDGGVIPERYKKKGFNKVGSKKRAPKRAYHKWEVLARKKKGDGYSYKIVKGGYRGMEDYSQHKNEERKKNFWSRMGGKDSKKANDPFSPLYWHKKFGTWEDGGEQQSPQQQVAQMISQALQQGAQPQQVVQMLVEQGVPQEQAIQMVQQVTQSMQQPQMEYGGLFGNPLNEMPDENLLGKKPGDPITFKYGGKKYSGTVEKIENGKLFLK